MKWLKRIWKGRKGWKWKWKERIEMKANEQNRMERGINEM